MHASLSSICIRSNNARMRIYVGFSVVISILFSIVLASALMAAVTSNPSTIKASYSSSRTNSFELKDKTVSGKIYVFVEPANVLRVTFNLDSTFNVVERYAPYDLGRTNSDGTAKPFNTDQLQQGLHSLSVTVVYKNGTTLIEKIGFITSGAEGTNVVTTQPNTTTSTTATTQPVVTTTRPVVVPNSGAKNWIIYSSNQETSNVELYISRLDGTQKSRLTNDPTYSNVWPRVTPNGKTVYFYRIPPGSITSDYFNYSLWRVNVDGTGLKEVIPKGANGWWLHAHVDISPDGQRLVFAALVTFKGLTLFTSDLNGNDLREIPTKTQGPIDPAWTPDGRVVFTATPPGIISNGESTLEVYITTLDGVGETRLTNDNLRDHDPAVSPDGKKISFLTLSDPKYMYPGKWTQRIMDIDGGNLRTLIGADHFSANPQWTSNDSTTYAYWDWDKAAWGIRVSKIDGSRSDILVAPKPAVGLSTSIVQDPFAFNK